jgi:lysozyme
MATMQKQHIKYAVIAGAALLIGYAIWGYISGWAPSRAEYSLQGIVISEEDGKANWAMLGNNDVDFAYITSTKGATQRDKNFAANLEGAAQAGIRYGALHRFDICRLASDQATSFITTVPRSANALPPAVELDFSTTCEGQPNRALILSELSTFLSQIEAHSDTTGKGEVRAVLMISKAFEAEYQISKAIDRNVWAQGNWFLPDYTAKPWVMWTANTARSVSGVERPVRWAVVRN